MNEKGNAPGLTIEIVTLFPDYFTGLTGQSIIGRGIDAGLFDINTVNLRDYGIGKHRQVDDTPFGGGGGMTLMLEPLTNCLIDLGCQPKDCSANENDNNKKRTRERLILTSAAGKRFEQNKAVELSLLERITIICGHYLGVDERLLDIFDIEELSVGDFVLTGGEPAAAILSDAICRLTPGALGNFSSALADSHQEGILGPAVYTRPETFRSIPVPAELLSGNHKEIERFRRESALKKTALLRPDILSRPEIAQELSQEEQALIAPDRREIKVAGTAATKKK
jgi:tRNA (guanine37-N1)-methyltransferase